MIRAWLLLALLASAPVAAVEDWMPDPALTPGAVNPAVTQDNIQSTICTSGWTATIRPPASYTNALKKTQLAQARYADKSMADYEEDHLVSLQLGGHPSDPQNLFPQPYAGRCGARVKDVIETKLKRLVCAGTLTLDAAQSAISTDWVAAYSQYVKPIECVTP